MLCVRRNKLKIYELDKSSSIPDSGRTSFFETTVARLALRHTPLTPLAVCTEVKHQEGEADPSYSSYLLRHKKKFTVYNDMFFWPRGSVEGRNLNFY